MTRIAIVHHPGVDPAGVRAAVERVAEPVIAEPGTEPALDGCSLVMTVGGDGTFLRGARLAVGAGLPVLGVNQGRLGFLTELQPAEVERGLERFLSGDFRVEERTALEARRDGAAAIAVNEVLLHRAPSLKVIRFAMSVDGRQIGTIDADGVVVATATGSTAYSLALGGPILEPGLADLVLVPMNPFALTVRPIVVGPGARVRIELDANAASLVTDGIQAGEAGPGAVVEVAAHPRRVRVVRFGPPDEFYRVLREKIGWGTPLVPRP